MKKMILTFGLLLVPGIAAAQLDLNEVIKTSEGEPINIVSDSLVIKNNENISIFEDNVKVKQGTMDLKADKMTVYSEINDKTKKSSFKRIEADGNVDFKSGVKSAKSDHADYDVKGGILVLSGNVYLQDSDSSLQGRTFTYNIKTGTSKISNSSISGNAPAGAKTAAPASGDAQPVQSGGRVKAVFTPGEDVQNFSMPMEAIQGVRGKERDTGEKKEVKPEIVIPGAGAGQGIKDKDDNIKMRQGY